MCVGVHAGPRQLARSFHSYCALVPMIKSSWPTDLTRNTGSHPCPAVLQQVHLRLLSKWPKRTQWQKEKFMFSGQSCPSITSAGLSCVPAVSASDIVLNRWSLGFIFTQWSLALVLNRFFCTHLSSNSILILPPRRGPPEYIKPVKWEYVKQKEVLELFWVFIP